MKYILLLILLIILLVLKLSGKNKNKSSRQENFRNQFHPDYIYRDLYYGDVTMEFDPADLVDGKLPDLSEVFGTAPSVSKSKETSDLSEEDQVLEKNRNDLSSGFTEDIFLFPGESLIDEKGKEVSIDNKENKEILNYRKENKEFLDRCYQDGNKYRYRFIENSALLRTIFEKLFHKKCENLLKERELEISELKNLPLTHEQLTSLNKKVKDLNYNLKQDDFNRMQDIISTGKNEKDVSKKLEQLVTRNSNIENDLNNMYLTKKSKKEELNVDTIQCFFGGLKYDDTTPTICLERYKADEDRCTVPSKKDDSTRCDVPECEAPRLVIGSCAVNSDDMPPYYFETNAHFIIKEHPDNPRRRLIMMAEEKEARKCESDKNYFGKFINVEDIKMKIEILNNEIVEDSTSPVVLKPEEEKKYKKLDEDIKKLEAEQGTFKMAPGETSIDYHQVTVEREKEMEERKRDYNSFHQTIRDERLKEKKDRLKKLEDSLKKGEKEVSDIEDSGEDNIITKRICLKYKLKGESLIVKLLYEDDKRNKPDNKGFKSDWFIEKYFDDTGKDTGLYKIRAEVNGLKFNLSKKPIPVTRVFLGYVFKFNPKPKLEEQLWLIRPVGDLNGPQRLGDVKEQTDILRQRNKRELHIIPKVLIEDVNKVVKFFSELEIPAL